MIFFLPLSHIPPCYHAKPPDFPRLIGPREDGVGWRLVEYVGGIMWCNSLGVDVASCRAMSGVRVVGILVMLGINVSLIWLLVIRGPCSFSTTKTNVYK